jgi:predicted extracellular nuclease
MRKFVIVTLGVVTMAVGLWTETSSATTPTYSKTYVEDWCSARNGIFSSDASGGGYGCSYRNDDGKVEAVACKRGGVCTFYRTQVLPPTKYGAAAGQGAASNKDIGSRVSTTSSTSGANSTLAAGSTSTTASTTKSASVKPSTTIGASGTPASGRPGLRQQ